MMFPSIAPMVLAHAAVERGRAACGKGQPGATAAFIAGYLICWTACGLGGSLRMGVEHRAWCIGCCWALMAALFALRMSVAWMAFVAALIAIEKLAPWKTTANRAIAVTLVVLGMAVAVVPEQVPGLTVPTSAGNGMTMEAS
jgi:predicted metal-binding membrane protein